MATKRANGEGNIRKKIIKGKIYWEGRYTGADGKQHSVSGKTQSEVRTKLQEKLKECEELSVQQANGQQCVITSNMTLNEAYDVYAHIFDTHIKPQSKETETITYNKWIKNTIGRYKLSTITPLLIQSQINIMAQNGLSHGYIKQILNTPHKVISYAYKMGIIDKMPFYFTKIQGKEKKTKRSLSEQEIQTILNTAKLRYKHLYPILLTLLYTGMRIGEALALTWQDIDFDAQCIHITKTRVEYQDSETGHKVSVMSSPKTATSLRDVPLIPQLKEILIETRNRQQFLFQENWNQTYYVFLNTREQPMKRNSCIQQITALNNYIRTHYDPDFPHFTAHYFRHTFASKAIENNVPPLYIQKICGWTNMNMLNEVYGHMSNQQALSSVKSMWAENTIS